MISDHIRIMASLHRPLGDGLVYFLHEFDGAAEGGDDFLVVLEIVVAQFAPAAVLEPFSADLVPADRKVPDIGRYAVKVLRFVDVNAAGCR